MIERLCQEIECLSMIKNRWAATSVDSVHIDGFVNGESLVVGLHESVSLKRDGESVHIIDPNLVQFLHDSTL